MNDTRKEITEILDRIDEKASKKIQDRIDKGEITPVSSEPQENMTIMRYVIHKAIEEYGAKHIAETIYRDLKKTELL